jgi:hypothetical protein
MADTLSAVVTSDASSYVTGSTIQVTVTFTNGDTAQTIEAINNLGGQATLLSNVKQLLGQSLALNGTTAFQFTATAIAGQPADLAQTLNWGFTTTTHNIAATGKDITVTAIDNVGGQWPDETN